MLVIALVFFLYINTIFLMSLRILREKDIDFSMSKGSSVSRKYFFVKS